MNHAPFPLRENANQLESELAAIASLSRADLVAQWTKIHGRPPPKGTSRRLLEYAAAYQLQAQALGDLKPKLRRQLCQQGMQERDPAPSAPQGRSAKALAPGTRLVREWHRTLHTIDILADGVLYDGKRYRSLSEVARAITGTRWSGPRFFGL